MKFEYEKRDVESVGGITTKDIGMKTGAKAFRILFGTMYKDIVKALVRELFTNGWDSQKNAGTLDIPIEVHAPNRFEPYFSIRDYGTGMTPETIDDIYSNVFASTKDESNDEAGFMGMGSKTPLGYADSFSLVSYVDGMYYAYDIFLNSVGAPVIALQAKGHTDEANGVLVQLAVGTVDIDRFAKVIEQFILGSSANVKLNGERFNNKFNIIEQYDNVTIYKTEHLSGPHVKMGCVLYRLDSYESGVFKGFNVILDFPIGTFNVTGSREDIVYDSASRKIITDAGEDFILRYGEKIQAKVKIADSYSEAHQIYHSAVSELPYGSKSVFSRKNMTFKWKNYDMSRAHYMKFKNELVYGFQIHRMKRKYNGESQSFKNIMKDENAIMRQPTSSIVIYQDENTKAARKKAAYVYDHIANSASNKDVFWVKGKPKESYSFFKLCTFLCAEQVIDLDSPLITYPKPEPRQRSKVDLVPVLQESSGYSKYVFGFYKDIEERGNKYYVPFDNKKSEYTYDEIKYALNFFGKSPRDVRIIGKTNQKYIDKYNMVDIVKACKECCSKINHTDVTINTIVYNGLPYKDSNILRAVYKEKYPITNTNIEKYNNLDMMSGRFKEVYDDHIKRTNKDYQGL